LWDGKSIAAVDVAICTDAFLKLFARTALFHGYARLFTVSAWLWFPAEFPYEEHDVSFDEWMWF